MFINRFILLFYYIYNVNKVLADTCQFYQGATSIIQSCSTGCCDTECCTDDYKTLATILGVVFGCLLFIVLVTVIVVCITRKRWSKKVRPKKDNENGDKTGIEMSKMRKLPSVDS